MACPLNHLFGYAGQRRH
ncbi:hypothetical protein, partial [Bacillus subtilis]